jgi:hypothetical protein|nr:MAG TPA: tail tube protein [Caudoviricetes sp.]DAY58165.1 MAG TPA: tail tube protein [Caudoviricetes sp.]
MTNPNMKYGEGTLKADGDSFDMTEISYSLNGKVRTATDNGQGYTTQTKGGWVKGKIHLIPGMSIEKIKAMDDVTVVWDTDTGQTYTAAHAWLEGEPEVVTGGFEVQFNFKKANEVVTGA